ncbi:MAG: hypothetical protein ACREOZ_03600, partial [Gloeomargaritales cyanobacterium]
HLFENVYAIHPKLDPRHGRNPLWMCMQQMGYNNVLDILELSDSDIDALTYIDPEDEETYLVLPLRYKKTLKYTVWWRNRQASQNEDNTTMDWDDLTEESFARFRQEVVPMLQANTRVREVTNTMMTTGISDVERFQGSIKRDSNSFPAFAVKNDEWFTFDRDLHATAKMQQVDRIFDIQTSPPAEGTRDKSLWDVQNSYLYSVLTTKVTKGQAAIFVFRECAPTGDAHVAYRRMHQHYTANNNRLALQVKYELKLNKLLWEYNYQGGPSRFLADFQQCVLDLEAAKQRPFDDNEKKSKFCLSIRDRDYYGIR